MALPILAGLGLRARGACSTPREERGALIALALTPPAGSCSRSLLVAFGADYLAPRNLVAAMIPVTRGDRGGRRRARAPGASGLVLAGAIALAFLAITLDVDLSPRLQRGNWRGVARALRPAGLRARDHDRRAGLGAARVLPAPLHNLPRGASVSVDEIDETGYAPLRALRRPAAGAGLSPARPPGHRRADRLPLRLAGPARGLRGRRCAAT